MVPAYWVGRPFGFMPAVYSVRLASLLLALTALPLMYLLAKELFPRRPAVWLAAPTLLVLVQGFNANVACVSNEALAIVAPIGALIFVVRGLRDLRLASALGAGGLLGLAVVNKTTALSLVPLIGLAWLVAALRDRANLIARLKWAVIGAGAAFGAVAPWVAFNFHTYGALSAAEPVRAITGQNQGVAPFSLSGFRTQWGTARTAFWEFQPASPGAAAYRNLWWAFVAVSVAAGSVIALLQRRWSEWRSLVWSGASVPIAFGVMLGIVYGVTSGEGLLVGRTLYPTLALVLIGTAGAWFMLLPRRLAIAGLFLVAGVLLIRESVVTRDYVERVYTAGVVNGEVPSVEQAWADEVRPAGEFVVEAPCATRMIGVGVAAGVPSVAIAGSDTVLTASLLGKDGEFSVYTLPTPVSGSLRVRLPDSVGILAARDDRNSHIAFVGRPGDPVARVYCLVDDPKSVRFQQRFAPFHADFLTRRRVLAWLKATEAMGWGLVLAPLLMAFVGLRRWIDR